MNPNLEGQSVTHSTFVIGERGEHFFRQLWIATLDTAKKRGWFAEGAFFEGADGPQIRESGWRILLERLATELTR
jgi:hypothetical protein